jgi:hypothetical protein
MSDWRIDEEQLLLLNTHLQRTDDQLIFNMLTRTAQESKLFPIMPYLMMCFYDAYYRFPDLLRATTEHLSPEEAGHRARNVTTNMQRVTSWGMLNFYLNGRTCLIKAGLLRPEDNLEDLWFMVDYNYRFLRSYNRANAHVWNLDAQDIAPLHEERTLQVLEADAFEADERLRRAAARFIAIGTQYSFLVHCESRVGLNNSGPYKLGDRTLMHVRDFTNLSECDFSWLDGVAADVTYNNLTLAVITQDVKIEVTDLGTAYTDPEDWQDRIVGVGLYTSDILEDRFLPVGMDSAADLADTLEGLTKELQEATRRLYARFSEMSFDQMVEAGIQTYFLAPSEIARMAGTYHQDEWAFVDDRTRRFWPLHNEEYSLDAYVSHFAAMDGRLGGQSDYYLHPVSYGVWRRSPDDAPLPASGRNASLVPARVLQHHDYPLRANPNGLSDARGTSSLPAKTGGFTFASGRFDEAEMNARARAFRSPLLEAPWRHVDEATVKYHWQDEEVDGLYRYTQERSRLLQDRGASLRRDDIDRIRREAGETPWREAAPHRTGSLA